MKTFILLIVLLIPSICFATPTPTATNTPTPTSNSPVTYPNPTLSPSVAVSGLTTAEVCDRQASTTVNPTDADIVTAAYGITPTPMTALSTKPNQGFIIDFAIPIKLGGVNTPKNMYPASTTATYNTPSRRAALTDKLWELTCNNSTWVTPLPLATAQSYAGSAAWSRYYKTFVNSAFPTPTGVSPTPTPTATNTPTP